MIKVYHYDLGVSPELSQDQKDRLLNFTLALSRESDQGQYGTFILSEYVQEFPDDLEYAEFVIESDFEVRDV